jgi:hypothetical protein
LATENTEGTGFFVFSIRISVSSATSVAKERKPWDADDHLAILSRARCSEVRQAAAGRHLLSPRARPDFQ